MLNVSKIVAKTMLDLLKYHFYSMHYPTLNNNLQFSHSRVIDKSTQREKGGLSNGQSI